MSRLGDSSKCVLCGWRITYIGPYWVHDGISYENPPKNDPTRDADADFVQRAREMAEANREEISFYLAKGHKEVARLYEEWKAAQPKPIDTANRFLVGIQGGDIVVMLPPKGPISKKHALNLAAHLVAMADDNDEFPKILEAVCNT